MPRLKHQTQSRLHSFIQVQRLYQGAFWLSSLALLNGGVVTAQTDPREPASMASTVQAATVDPSPVNPPASLESPAPVSIPELVQPVAPASNNLSKSDNSGVFNDAYVDSTSYDIGATNRSGQAAPTLQPDRVPSTRSIAGDPKPQSIGDDPIPRSPVVDSERAIASEPPYHLSLQIPISRNIGDRQLIFPLLIPAPITSLFGWRVHPISGVLRFHSGTDLGASLGTPVLAAYAGRVAIADFLGGYGLAVSLQHQKNAQETLYAHLSEVFVRPGQWVNQGDIIGRVGETGTATGPNLHFELRQLTSEGWVAIDANASLKYALVEFTKALQTDYVGRSSASLESRPPLQQQSATPWFAMDDGTKLRYLLAQLINILQVNKSASSTQS